MKKSIKHIGNVIPLCRASHGADTWLGGLREDLPYKQYRDMPKNSVFSGKYPTFRMCKKCLAIIKKRG